MTELQCKKRCIQEVEVETQATKEERRNIAQACGDGVRKAKAKLDLKLARDVSGNEMLFIRKRLHKENMVLLLSGTNVLVTADTDKGEIVDVFFGSDFTNKVSQAFCHKARFKERRNYKLGKRIEAGIFYLTSLWAQGDRIQGC